jgi:hypothetical protein
MGSGVPGASCNLHRVLAESPAAPEAYEEFLALVEESGSRLFSLQANQMEIEIPEGDLVRAPSSEPDMEYPDIVEIRLWWGKKACSHLISAAEFFGRGEFGAPMPAEKVVQHINRLRRMWAPK